MPWKENQLMYLREQFVLRAKEKDANIGALCREFCISRKTGYKWISRYQEEGWAGLSNRSRRPTSIPSSTSAEVAVDVIATRKKYPRWGARKIQTYLKSSHDDVPSIRTIARLLERAGMVQIRRVRPKRTSHPTQAPVLMLKAPNDVWTVDYKGWWLSPTGQRWEPLTIRDAFSRFVLRIELLHSTSGAVARKVFEKVFSEYGLPKAILSDNGTPFAARHGRLGLTTLSAWWISLGIEHIRSRPGCPSDNGAHERMHREMQDDLMGSSSLARRQGVQGAWDQWRHEFNHVRPHDAIGLKTPGDLYCKSRVAFEDKPILHLYPEGFDVRLVDKIGKIRIHGRRVFISHALRELNVGLEAIENDGHYLWLGQKKLGRVDLKNGLRVFSVL